MTFQNLSDLSTTQTFDPDDLATARSISQLPLRKPYDNTSCMQPCNVKCVMYRQENIWLVRFSKQKNPALKWDDKSSLKAFKLCFLTH